MRHGQVSKPGTGVRNHSLFSSESSPWTSPAFVLCSWSSSGLLPQASSAGLCCACFLYLSFLLFSAIPNLPTLRKLPTHALEVKPTLQLGLSSPMPFPFTLSFPCQNLSQFCFASQVKSDPPAPCSLVPNNRPTCGNIPSCLPKLILRGLHELFALLQRQRKVSISASFFTQFSPAAGMIALSCLTKSCKGSAQIFIKNIFLKMFEWLIQVHGSEFENLRTTYI